MFSKGKFLSFLLVMAMVVLLTTACAVPTPVTPAAAEPEVDNPAESEAGFNPATASLEEVIAYVEEVFPPEQYMTNDFIPDESEWQKLECNGNYEELSVITGWVFNDEHAHLYVPDRLGFFEDVCLEITLKEGGAEVDELTVVAAGKVDIGSIAGGSGVPRLVASKTSAPVVAVAAGLQTMPYGLLCLDSDTPPNQRSTLQITPSWFKGKIIGAQPDGRYLVENFLIERFDELEPGDFKIESAGFLPTPLIEGKWDCYGAFETNQPRFLEAEGYLNWTFFSFARDAGFNSFSNVQVVGRKFLEERPETLRRYLAAVRHGIQFILDNPEEAAKITVQYAHDAGHTEVSYEQALRRFELERALIGEPVFYMPPEVWSQHVAILLKYGQIESLK